MNKADATQTAIRREKRLMPPEMGRQIYLDCLINSDTGEIIYDVAVWGDQEKSREMADKAISSFLSIHKADFSHRMRGIYHTQIDSDPSDSSDEESTYCFINTNYLRSRGLIGTSPRSVYSLLCRKLDVTYFYRDTKGGI